MKNNFPRSSEVDRDSQLYELEDLEIRVPPIGSNEEYNATSILNLSGSDTHEIIPQKELVMRSSRKSIPRRHFEIEREAFMVAPHYFNEPNNFEQAMKSQNKEKWMSAMKMRWSL